MAYTTNIQPQGEYLQMDLKMTQGDTLLSRWLYFVNPNFPVIQQVPLNLNQLTIKFGIRRFPDDVAYTSSSMPINCEINSAITTINSIVYPANTLFRINLPYTETDNTKLAIPNLAVQSRFFYDIETLDFQNVKTTIIKGELLVTKQIVKI